MKLIFKNDNLRELYQKGFDSKESRRYSKGVIKSYRKKIVILDSLSDLSEIRKYRSLKFESLNNYPKGGYSIRVNRQYRIVFNVLEDGKFEIIEIVELVDYR